jgi:prepilin-type N-terminal cleavage/methylation domain-containing protein
MQKTGNNRGMTLLEVLVVVIVMAVLITAIAPLVRTVYFSWITADRRAESVATGRVGMSKLVDEIRIAHDLYSATDSTYIDYYPQWATNTFYRRFKYNTAANYDFQYGVATPTFAADSLAAPLDSMAYISYTRHLVEGVTRARRINAFKFVFAVSDERKLLPRRDALNPIVFRSQAQMRMSREGFMIAKSIAFASESYIFSRGSNPQLCIKVFCDRVDNLSGAAQADIYFGMFGHAILPLNYVADGDYYAACCNVRNPPCSLGNDPNTNVDITLSDGLEFTIIRDMIRVGP